MFVATITSFTLLEVSHSRCCHCKSPCCLDPYLYFIVVDCLVLVAIVVIMAIVSFSYLPQLLNFCLELVFAYVVVLRDLFLSVN